MRTIAFLLTLLAAVVAAKPAKKGDPLAPDTWKASPTAFEGKVVKTAVLGLEDPGLYAGDTPVVAVLIHGGNEQDDSGGDIIALVSPGGFKSFVETYSGRQLGGGRSGFGALSKARVVSGTFARVAGDPALLIDIPAATAAALPKPSDRLKAQAELARSQQLKPTREGWQRKPFILSHLDQRGAAETTRELQRLLDLVGTQTGKDKARVSVRDAIAAAKSGESKVIADPQAKIEWVLTWQ